MGDTNTGPEAPRDAELDADEAITLEDDSAAAEDESGAGDESEALAKVRREAKNLRDRAKTAEARVDELSRELFALKVSALDKLADATDLAYDPELLDDDKLTEAVDVLLAAKPHMAKPRKPNGSVGQGQRGNDIGPMDFSSLLR